jgi:hypothetical protein
MGFSCEDQKASYKVFLGNEPGHLWTVILKLELGEIREKNLQNLDSMN